MSLYEVVYVGVVTLGLLLLVFRLWWLYGSYYITFASMRYWVWQRGIIGPQNLIGTFDTEQDALACIEKLKLNPRGIINKW